MLERTELRPRGRADAGVEDVRVVDEGGWIEATYNYVRQTNRYGDVRALGSLAFSLAW